MTDEAEQSIPSRGSVAHPLAESLRDMSDTLNACGNDFSDILLDAARELDRRRWIPVQERLPELGIEVVALWEGVPEFASLLDDGAWWIRGGSARFAATHWMPIPAY